MPNQVPFFVTIALCALFVLGCRTPLAIKQIQAKNPLAKNAAKTPIKIVDVWDSYAQKTPEGKVMRGMAGQVLFYDEQKNNRAVNVDGDLTVYVFDGKENDPAHTKPIKIYQFSADILKKHHVQKKTFGHGYHFFLPIDEIGGEEKPLSILVRFDDHLTGEDYVVTKPVNTLLAGRKPALSTTPTIREFLDSHSLMAEAKTAEAHRIQQAGYVESEKESASKESVATESVATESVSKNNHVSTISLNSGMTRRLLEGKKSTGKPSPPNEK